jgi:hypothetical protein
MNATESKDQPSWKQMLALATFIAGVLGEILSNKRVQQELQNKGKLRKKILELFDVVADAYTEIREEWQKFYQSEFGMEVDLNGVQVPEKPEGNYRLLFIAKGLTPNKVFDSWKFPKWRYNDDLDKAVPTNKRTATEHYAIWVLIGDEPDAEFLGKSTKTADPSMEIGMTLLERMIFESEYFLETGKHLDVKGVTFCSGSRYSDGRVPNVDLHTDGKVYVGWCNLGYSDSKSGIRRAVTL